MKVIPTINPQGRSVNNQNVSFGMKLTTKTKNFLVSSQNLISSDTLNLLQRLKARKDGCVFDMTIQLPEPNKFYLYPLRFNIKVKKKDILILDKNIPARDKSLYKLLGRMMENSFTETYKDVGKYYEYILKAKKTK